MSTLVVKNKLISILVTSSIIFTFLFPVNLLQAQTPVTDTVLIGTTGTGFTKLIAIMTGVAPSEDTNPYSIKNLSKLALKRVLRQLTTSIVEWIDSGFEGNPAFITNTGQFLRDTADITIGDFLMNDPALSFLCDPFKIQVKLALGLQYRPFQEQIKCSFTDALGNVNEAMDNFLNGDFIGGGGWDSWLQITTVPQNNQMGAMILAQGELDARIEASTGQAVLEANWGGGFMSWKDCPDYTISADSTNWEAEFAEGEARDSRLERYAAVTGQKRGSDGCVIKTPGGVIANKINWADTSTLRELELADDVNAIISALLNQLLTLGMESISDAGLLGGNALARQKSKDAYASNYNEYMAYLQNLDTELYANENTDTTNTGDYNSDGSANFNRDFESRGIALETVNDQLNVENGYLKSQQDIFTLLDNMEKSFASSSCDTKTEIIGQIQGISNYDRSAVGNLFYNKAQIALNSPIAINNIANLNSAKASLENATSDAQVSAIVQPLSTGNFHSAAETFSYSVGGSSYIKITDWINKKIQDNSACLN